jgi:hypothetical protein
MRRFRYSVGGLMMIIVLLAAAIAALRYPSPLWANVWFSLAASALTLAVPAAVYHRGEQRAFWVGFASCGWVYFVLALFPWFQAETGFQLVTTTLLDLAAPHIISQDQLVRSYAATFEPGAAREPSIWQVWNLPEFPPRAPWINGYATLHSPGVYLRIGHAVFCMVVAILGGGFVSYLSSAPPRSSGTQG